MKITIGVVLAAIASETLAAFVKPKLNVERATFALCRENGERKEGPWLSGEVDGNGHIIDSNLPAKFRNVQMNYESDCQPTWKRSPNPPKTTADFLQHLEAVRIGEEVGKPTKQNTRDAFAKPASSWISQVPRRPLEGDISACQASPASDGYSPASTDFRTKIVPENRSSSLSAWIDHQPRKRLEGDFSVHEFDMEERKRNSPTSTSLEKGKSNSLGPDPPSPGALQPSCFVPTTPLPIPPPGVAARFSQEYHSGHHPSWFHFSTSDALIEGSTLKRIRITEQSPFYLSQPSIDSDEAISNGQDTMSAPPGFVEAEFEEDELASEVTRLREIAMEAAEAARAAEMAAAKKSQQARKASEEARLAEINAVEKAIAARDAAQTARLALENMRKAREEEAARLAEEARLEALNKKEEQARLEVLLARQEKIAREMKKEQEALLQRQRERAIQEESAAQVKRDQEALLERQRERARQEDLSLQMKQEQEQLLERQREWSRQDKSAHQLKEEQISLRKLQHEGANGGKEPQRKAEETPEKGAFAQREKQESESQSQIETASLREEFRLAQIEKKKAEEKNKQENKAAAPVTDRRPALRTEKKNKEEVQRLLDLAIEKQKDLHQKENVPKRSNLEVPIASSTAKEYQNNMKSSFRRDERTPVGDERNARTKKSSATSSGRESPAEKVLRTKIEKAMKQKNEPGSDSKTGNE